MPVLENKIVIITSKECVKYFVNSIENVEYCPKINVVLTVGAGDSFNAGFLYGLWHH